MEEVKVNVVVTEGRVCIVSLALLWLLLLLPCVFLNFEFFSTECIKMYMNINDGYDHGFY